MPITAEHQSLFDAVLALPETERGLLVEQLLESLGPEPDYETEEEFAAELQRRYEEYQRDPSVAIPWSEVQKMT